MLETLQIWISQVNTNLALWLLITSFILLDVILGIINAFNKKELSSSIMRQGVMHKTGFLGSMLLCNLIDLTQSVAYINEHLGFSIPASVLCAVMIITCEILSICEHLKNLNPNIKLDFIKNKTSD